MLVIDATNVNDAWHQAKMFLNRSGETRPSRVGQMLEYPEPVTTNYMYPRERVLFDAKRDCNPFFHFFEGLWMLAGRNDVAWISQFNQRMMSYSDDGVTYHAAYGHRWRHHFSIGDQLPEIIRLLKANKEERRAVLQMWDPKADLGRSGKDLPCNTAVYFKIRKDRLCMTVTNRSNDVVWGCYGANVVHMSMLQEYVAHMVDVGVGPYHQMSDSWHAYTEYWAKYGGTDTEIRTPLDYYSESRAYPYPLIHKPESFDQDLSDWVAEPDGHGSYGNHVFTEVAMPMYQSWRAYKEKNFKLALTWAGEVEASDWRIGCNEWLERRIAARESKESQSLLERKVA